MPGIIVLRSVRQQEIQRPGISAFALSLHRDLSENYTNWARERVKSEKAKSVNQHDISGTEWPLFGTVFYLWATESIQQELMKSGKTGLPRQYAKESVEAAARLIADTAHAGWVKKYWGENYLHRENVFYRMLLLSGLTSYHHITGNDKYNKIIKDQVSSLSRELDQSKTGLLDDYPGKCYPSVILAAVANIQRASKSLGIDKSAFIKRQQRAFASITDKTGLPTYSADAELGRSVGTARGNANSFLLTFAPEVYPEQSKKWFDDYVRYFWQEKWFAKGFREFPKSRSASLIYMDVDAGPVLGGFGFAASAFGVAASRANGRFDLAYPMSGEMIALSWPLPSGDLLFPRFLSNAANAPFVGEAGILFCLTTQPVLKNIRNPGEALPGLVWIILGIYFLTGTILLRKAIRKWQQREKWQDEFTIRKQKFYLFAAAILTFVFLLIFNHYVWILLLILAMQFIIF